MYNIKNSVELNEFQKKILLKLYKSSKFKKILTLFELNKNIENYFKFYNYIYKKLNCIITNKLRNNSKKDFTFSFNLTNNNGVVYYNNKFTINSKNHIKNFSSKNKHKIMALFKNINNNILFNNKEQNKIVSIVFSSTHMPCLKAKSSAIDCKALRK